MLIFIVSIHSSQLILVFHWCHFFFRDYFFFYSTSQQNWKEGTEISLCPLPPDSFPIINSMSKAHSSQLMKLHWCIIDILYYGSFPSGSVGKESAYNAGPLGSIPGLWISPRKENGNPLQLYRQDNSMDRGARQAIVHGVIRSQTRLCNQLSLSLWCGKIMFSLTSNY